MNSLKVCSYLFSLLFSIVFLNGCDCIDFNKDDQVRNYGDPIDSVIPRTGFDCSRLNYQDSNFLYSEDYGHFHNAFMEFLETRIDTFDSLDDTVNFVVLNLKDFSLINRFEYTFLPNDSADLIDYIDDVNAATQDAYEISIMDGNDFTDLLTGYTSGAKDKIEELGDIFSQYPDTIDYNNIQDLLSDISVWEAGVSASLLSSNEKEKLLYGGVIARYSLYYWSCYIYYGGPEDWIDHETGEITYRGTFWNWLKKRALLIGAFDVAGFFLAGGPCGAALSSGIVGAGLFLFDKP